MERAMIETCEVLGPLRGLRNARAMPFGTRAVSEGARLWARTTEGSSRLSRPPFCSPMSSAAICREMSRTSSARAGHVLVLHGGEHLGVLLADREDCGLRAFEVLYPLCDPHPQAPGLGRALCGRRRSPPRSHYPAPASSPPSPQASVRRPEPPRRSVRSPPQPLPRLCWSGPGSCSPAIVKRNTGPTANPLRGRDALHPGNSRLLLHHDASSPFHGSF